MKESREQIEGYLAESKHRLAELESRGADALSRYDIEIAGGGTAQSALSTALMLVRNHVAYYERQLAAMPPAQAKLL